MKQQVPVGVVLADAGYGKGTQFRTDLTQLGLQYKVGIESNATVWKPGQQPLPPPAQSSASTSTSVTQVCGGNGWALGDPQHADSTEPERVRPVRSAAAATVPASEDCNGITSF